MVCEHEYNKNWEFGPIIMDLGNSTPKHWFYKKCIKCGNVILFSTGNLNNLNNYSNPNDILNIFSSQNKTDIENMIQLFPKINLNKYL